MLAIHILKIMFPTLLVSISRLTLSCFYFSNLSSGPVSKHFQYLSQRLLPTSRLGRIRAEITRRSTVPAASRLNFSNVGESARLLFDGFHLLPALFPVKSVLSSYRTDHHTAPLRHGPAASRQKLGSGKQYTRRKCYTHQQKAKNVFFV